MKAAVRQCSSKLGIALTLHFISVNFKKICTTISCKTAIDTSYGRWLSFLKVSLSGNCPHFSWLNNLRTHKEAVVFVVICDDDAALLFTSKHKLYIILNVSTGFIKCFINVLSRKIDNGETVLKFMNDVSNLIVCLFLLINRDELSHT